MPHAVSDLAADCVRVTGGVLRGRRGTATVAFRNIPYAAPPVGPLRFLPPRPAPAWTGERDASVHGPIAPQPVSRLAAAMGDFDRPQDEDCLTLTITRPAAPDTGRPVVVALHGGAYLSGAGSLDWYDGAVLAEEGGAVVVGVNYRLGPLGFLHHPALGQPADTPSPGLCDMIAALRWVRTEIAAFGGDPGRVTVMGQSAGAHAILCMLALPETEGLFARAIFLSPPPTLPPLTEEAAAPRAERLGALVGIDPPTDPPTGAGAQDWAAKMRAIPARELALAQSILARELARPGDVSPPFVPVLNRATPPSLFEAAAQAAASRGIPLIAGTTQDEMLAFLAPDPALAALSADEGAARIAALSGDPAPFIARHPGASGLALLSDFLTDRRFGGPTVDFLDAVARAGGQAWAYRFDWHAPGNRFGACHCIDLPFVFGTFPAWAGAAMLDGGDPAGMPALAVIVRRALLGFIGGGAPEQPHLPWPPYDTVQRHTMCFGERTGATAHPV